MDEDSLMGKVLGVLTQNLTQLANYTTHTVRQNANL
jgi:hypothetical protein